MLGTLKVVGVVAWYLWATLLLMTEARNSVALSALVLGTKAFVVVAVLDDVRRAFVAVRCGALAGVTHRLMGV